MNMDFGSNKTPVKVIKEDAFVGTCFIDIYSGVNSKWYRKKLKESNKFKNIDQIFFSLSYWDVNVNKYGVKCGRSLRFLENNGWINFIDPHGWLQWYFRYCLGRTPLDDERQINWWKRIVSRFKKKLIKMTKDDNSKFDDYSTFRKIRKKLLQCGYKLVENNFFLCI